MWLGSGGAGAERSEEDAVAVAEASAPEAEHRRGSEGGERRRHRVRGGGEARGEGCEDNRMDSRRPSDQRGAARKNRCSKTLGSPGIQDTHILQFHFLERHRIYFNLKL